MNDCSVIVCSVDSFSDVWPPALECLRRFWPDCPWPLYTLSNKLPWGERPILTGEDYGWTANLRIGVDKANTEFVMVFLEDMLVCDPVETAYLVKSLEALKGNPNLGGVLVGPGPQTFEPMRHTHFGRTFKTSPYRVSTSPTIWRAEFLKRLLDCGKTAWEFEQLATRASVGMPEEIWVVAKEPRPCSVAYTAITRSEAEQGALIWLERLGIEWIPNRPIRGFQRGQKWPRAK